MGFRVLSLLCLCRYNHWIVEGLGVGVFFYLNPCLRKIVSFFVFSYEGIIYHVFAIKKLASTTQF